MSLRLRLFSSLKVTDRTSYSYLLYLTPSLPLFLVFSSPDPYPHLAAEYPFSFCYFFFLFLSLPFLTCMHILVEGPPHAD